MKQIGFFQDSTGERSSTKLINFLVAFCIMAMWVCVSIVNKEITELPGSVIALLGATVTGSGIKQLIDGAFPGKKIEIIRKVLKTK